MFLFLQNHRRKHLQRHLRNREPIAVQFSLRKKQGAPGENEYVTSSASQNGCWIRSSLVMSLMHNLKPMVSYDQRLRPHPTLIISGLSKQVKPRQSARVVHLSSYSLRGLK